MFNGLKRGIVICACAALAVSCMDYGPIEKEDFEIDNAGSGDEVTGKGLFITNEGNFHVRQCLALLLRSGEKTCRE